MTIMTHLTWPSNNPKPQNASKPVSKDRFVGSAAHADALKPGVSGFVRHHLFVHKGRKSQRSTRHYLNQRSWARRDRRDLEHRCWFLRSLYQVRIPCSGIRFFVFLSMSFVEGVHFWGRRWHHVRLGPEDARDWARPKAKHPLSGMM